jgi:hypothetical protein
MQLPPYAIPLAALILSLAGLYGARYGRGRDSYVRDLEKQLERCEARAVRLQEDNEKLMRMVFSDTTMRRP